MEIILLRHGMPTINTDVRLTAAELAGWVDEYNNAGIDPDSAPPESTLKLFHQTPFVVCSDLRRSRESAHRLGVERIDVCDATFRELELPLAGWRYPRLGLPAWMALFRVIWMAGYFLNGNSFPEARQRGHHCAERLAEWANGYGRVVFVGHGALNWLIARNLTAMGWSGPRRPPQRHWEFAVYRYEGMT